MRLLLVEDDTRLAEALSKSLHHKGYAITHMASAANALASLTSNEFAMMILDLGLPDMDGVDLLKLAKKNTLP
jgi:two-component system OmpR family response regulator